MEILGIIAAIASAASWACGTLIFDRLGRHVPPAGITFIKGALSIILLAILTMLSGGFESVNIEECLYLAVSGIIGIAIGDTLFFKSLSDLGPKVQVLYFMLGQVMTMLLSFLFLSEVLSINEYIGAIILLIGIMVVIWGKQEDHPNKTRGIIYGFLSILCFSVSSVIVKYAIADFDVVSATFYRMFFGTIGVLFVGVSSSKLKNWVQPLKQMKIFALFVFNVFVITIGGFLLSMYAIKNISVSLASVLSTTEPIFVLIFAYLFNKDKATNRELIGAVIAIVGLIIVLL